MTFDLDTLDQQAFRLAQAFDRRAPRERKLLIGAAAVVLLWLVNSLWFDPLWQQWVSLRQQQQAAATTLQTLQDDNARLQLQRQSRKLQVEAEIRMLRTRLAQANADAPTPGHDGQPAAAGLVGPQEMLTVLTELLARRDGLRLRSLQSLGATPLSASGGTAQAGAGIRPTLHRHAVELNVEGRYADLVAYLQALEALPQGLLWGPLQLKVEHHPQVSLTLRIHTLSQQTGWVAL